MDWVVYLGIALKVLSALIGVVTPMLGGDAASTTPLILSGFMAGSALTSAGQKQATTKVTDVVVAAAPPEKAAAVQQVLKK